MILHAIGNKQFTPCLTCMKANFMCNFEFFSPFSALSQSHITIL